MKTDLSTLTDEEINKLALKEIMGFELRDHPFGGKCYHDGNEFVSARGYNFCDKHSNQIVNYVLPRLHEAIKLCRIEIVYYKTEWFVHIDESDDKKVLASGSTAKKDELNRILLECCIEAMEISNG